MHLFCLVILVTYDVSPYCSVYKLLAAEHMANKNNPVAKKWRGQAKR